MCGRFVRAQASETYGDLFGVRDIPDFAASYNVAWCPTIIAKSKSVEISSVFDVFRHSLRGLERIGNKFRVLQ